MRRTVLFVILPALVLTTSILLLSCDDDALTDGRSSWLSGNLLFRYQFGAEELFPGGGIGYRCEARGTIKLQRSAGVTVGTYEQIGECEGPGGVTELREEGTVMNGSQDIGGLRFETELCVFEGTLLGNPPTAASGDVYCDPVLDGVTIPLSGEFAIWSGVASVLVSPDSVIVPLDDDLVLEATLLGPTDHELSGWDVTWESSDPSVATVDGSGRVAGVAEGEFLITVTSIPKLPLEEAVTLTVPGRVALKFVAVQAGAEHTCGLTSNGRLYCWGRGDAGQLGDDSEVEAQPLPVQVQGRFRTFSAGYRHTCGVSDRGLVYCWGSNEHLALGRNYPAHAPNHWWIPLDGEASLLAAGTHATCAGDWGWGLSCWGSNVCGQLGCGTVGGPDQPSPLPVPGLAWPVTLSLTRTPSGEAGHGCVTTSDFWGPAAAHCWGHGTSGQLGNGRNADAGELQPVRGVLGLKTVSAGAEHTCGVASDGRGYCWGDASTGALGTGSTVPAIQSEPVEVAGGHTFGVISAGDHFTCAVEHGHALCWGEGASNQLGNGLAVPRLEPTPVGGDLHFRSVSAGGTHACGVGADGMLYCWGGNEFGQLGTGDLDSRAVPALVVFE